MKILVLGGGADQAALIRELHNRGHEVILLDYLPDCPARNLVDKHYRESTLDPIAVERVARDESVNLICTACTDQALLTVAQVSQTLGLPCYISFETARNVTNKRYMKERMRLCSIPTAAHHVVKQGDCMEIPSDLHFPVVIKPADCNSSKGVQKVLTPEEFNLALTEALQLSRTQTAIVEDFIDGREISADLYVYDNKAHFLSATTSIKIADSEHFTIIGSQYPAISPQQEQQICEIGANIAKAFNLNNCPLLIQLLLDETGQFFVIEFSARMGGGSKYHLIKTLSGVDIMSTYVDLILGDPHDVSPRKQVNCAAMKFVYCTPGIIGKFEGFDQAKEMGIISKYFYYKVPGAKIEKVETSSDRAAGYLVVADSAEELEAKCARADLSLKILDEKGRDIMIHNIR